MSRPRLLPLFSARSLLLGSAFGALAVTGSACTAGDRQDAAQPAAQAAAYDSAPPWLLARRDQEQARVSSSPVRHDFQFTDALAASGIAFVQQIVDDAGKTYKAVHYDHGTGLCAADIDADGKTDLFFVSQRGRNALVRNLGGGRFADITERAGLGAVDQIGVSCAFGDVDNDGRPDLFLTTVRHGNHLYHNEGDGQFRDITASAGLGYVGHSSGAVFFDYDRDGRLDLFVANVGRYTTNDTGAGGFYVGMTDAFQGHLHPERTEISRLYRNAGNGRFTDVTQRTGLNDTGWSGDATVIDIDEDGFPDLYVTNMQGANHLWHNEGGARFQDRTATYFPRTPFGAMGIKAFDFNGDGRLDVYVTDMHSDMIDMIDPGDWAGKARKTDSAHVMTTMVPDGRAKHIFGNALFANRGGSTPFAEVSDSVGLETYWPWGPSVDDVNADGWDDVFVTNGMNFPYPYASNDLFLSDAGRSFLPAAFALGVEPRRHGATEQLWFTAACGPTGADRASKACQQCNGPEAAKSGCHVDANGTATMTATRGSRSSVILDIDGDGDLDIVTNEFNAAPQLLLSNLSTTKSVHWLSLTLRGTRSNASALGARVTVTLPNGRKLVKVLDGQSGYLSHSVLPLYFGLGDADAATGAEIVWPSGVRELLTGPLKGAMTATEAKP